MVVEMVDYCFILKITYIKAIIAVQKWLKRSEYQYKTTKVQSDNKLDKISKLKICMAW